MIKKLSVAFVFLCCTRSYAQENDFCEALSAIIGDAPNKFRNVRGNVTDDNMNATIWACAIKVPGTINSRFVAAQGLFYEGAFLQTAKKDDLKAGYARVKEQLSGCLTPLGYEISSAPTFVPGIEDYKKIIFMKAFDENIKPENAPPHVALEALYSKELGTYTIVAYVFEH